MTETCGVERKRNKTLPRPYRDPTVVLREVWRGEVYTLDAGAELHLPGLKPA